MKTFLLPYKAESNSAKALGQALNIKRIKLENSKFVDSPNKIVINWGNSKSNYKLAKYINHPRYVGIASNKLKFFQTIEEYNMHCEEEHKVNIPEWTQSADIAQDWLNNESDVICRHTLTGHSGEGIELIHFDEHVSDLPPPAKLYTKYVKKRDEYRIHILNGIVFDVQKKASRRTHATPTNYQIRNHDNGFVFIRHRVDPPQDVINQARLAVNVVGLHFGAVDVIWNEKKQYACVLEINTACGLQNTTLRRYRNSLKAFLLDEPIREWDNVLNREDLGSEQIDATDLDDRPDVHDESERIQRQLEQMRTTVRQANTSYSLSSFTNDTGNPRRVAAPDEILQEVLDEYEHDDDEDGNDDE